MKKIDAYNVAKTLDWIAQDINSHSFLEPKKNKNGVYECIIYLSLIEKTIIGLGDSKIESIDNATREAAKLIDQYQKNNPSLEVNAIISTYDWYLIEDDNGILSLSNEGIKDTACPC